MVKTISYVPRLRQQYNDTVAKAVAEELSITNKMRIPKLEKIVVSVGLGRAKDDKRLLETAENTLRKITGQHPIKTKARKSIANFKLREGNVIGLKVTLRGNYMYEFFDRLVTNTLPRLRDFHGVKSKSFDFSGNYHIGIKEHSVFPELSFEETTLLHGLEISIITTANNAHEGYVLLKKMGMPLEKEKNG